MKKKNKLLIFLVGLIFGISVSYAVELIKAKEVTFINGTSGLKANNVQDAIEELYNKSINDESCKNESAPKLSEGLIPVTIENDGTVKYADTSKSWYNYCDKRWANAVILESGAGYKVGDTISGSDIQSYFVWIPKYKYKLWNTGTASEGVHEIEIVFDEKNTTDIEGLSCETPMTSGGSGNCNNGEYMTHPAFVSMNTNGFWVGKFETGYKGATSTTSAQVNSNDSSKVIIKPNVYSWRNITVKNIFETSYNYKREMDSHMMKNTEWGAVAYLSHSKYGIGKKVTTNNNSSYKTGYSIVPSLYQETTPIVAGDANSYNSAYNTENGYNASTTGNISGVYDMSGGAWEYTTGYISGNFGSSGFNTTTVASFGAKYFDAYNASSGEGTYHYRIFGDATGEKGPFKNYTDEDGQAKYHSNWYKDDSRFIDSTYPWFARGGHTTHGNLASIMCFSKHDGGAYTYMGYRIVLTP